MNNVIERALDRIDTLLVRDGHDTTGNVLRAEIADLLREVHADGASPFAKARDRVALASTPSTTVTLTHEVRIVFTVANDDGTDAREVALAFQGTPTFPHRIVVENAARDIYGMVCTELLRRLTEAR